MSVSAKINWRRALNEIKFKHEELELVKEICDDHAVDFQMFLEDYCAQNQIGLNKLNVEKNSFVLHAGTKLKNDKIFANGGRVLNFVGISDDYITSRNAVIEKIEKLNWSGGFYRPDIGFKIIK